jgi:hypothetical protein
VLLAPTAVHVVALVQDTPCRYVPSGAGPSVQLVPFQSSTNGGPPAQPIVDVAQPTAMHEVVPVQASASSWPAPGTD